QDRGGRKEQHVGEMKGHPLPRKDREIRVGRVCGDVGFVSSSPGLHACPLDDLRVGGVAALGVQREALNAPRWPRFSGGFHEAWFVCASVPGTGQGLWLRYAVDSTKEGASASLWAACFDRERPDRTLALRNTLQPAAIGRGAAEAPGAAGGDGVRIGSARLDASTCKGEVEAGGHALRWRLSFGRGAEPEDAIPRWLAPIARLRG